jgi:hypothetical protein
MTAPFETMISHIQAIVDQHTAYQNWKNTEEEEIT